MARITNISVLKAKITKNQQRLVQIKNQMIEAANAPGHVPYASFKRWEKQTREIRQKIVGLETRLRRESKKAPVIIYDSTKQQQD